MVKPVFNDIAIPCFDLTWVSLKDKQGNSHHFAFVAGGGGTKTKSGVLNKIVVFKYAGDSGMKEVTAIECKHGLCENLCTSVVSGHVLVCASFQQKCVLMEITMTKDNTLSSKDLVVFATEELKDEDMSFNACCFSSFHDKTYIVTGGENGACHVWLLSFHKGNWNIEKTKVFKHHDGPIRDVRSHPSNAWVCTGGEDGTCRIVDIAKLAIVKTVHCTSGGIDGGSKTPQCRACGFSIDGDKLFTVQSARVGNAHIVQWDIESDKNEPKEEQKVVVSPKRVVLASKFPVTRLALNIEDDLLAVGDCDGKITLFDAKSLVKQNSFQCHDFPVTGLGFAPSSAVPNSDQARKDKKPLALLFSCSADNKLSTILVQNELSIVKVLLMVFCLLALLYIYYMTKY